MLLYVRENKKKSELSKSEMELSQSEGVTLVRPLPPSLAAEPSSLTIGILVGLVGVFQSFRRILMYSCTGLVSNVRRKIPPWAV